MDPGKMIMKSKMHLFIFLAMILDMFRTSTNVMDDCVGCVIVNRLESKNRI